MKNIENKTLEQWLEEGRAFVKEGDFTKAEEALTQIFKEKGFFKVSGIIPKIKLGTLFHYKKNRILYAKAYSDLSQVAVYQGNLGEAQRLLLLANNFFEKNNMEEEYLTTLCRLGDVYRFSCSLENAEEMFRSALEIIKKYDDKERKGDILGNLGLLCEAGDRFDEAINYHKEALLDYESIDNKQKIANQYRQIALTFLRAGQNEEAISWIDKAIFSYKNLNNKIMLSRTLNDKTLALKDDEAIKCAKEAFDAANNTNDDFEIADNSLLYARLLLDKEAKNKEIEKLLFNSLEHFKKILRQSEIANTSSTLGLYYLRNNQLDEAESRFKDSLYVEQRLHRDFGMASDYCNLGLISKMKNKKDDARDYWYKAVVLFEQNDDYNHADEIKREISKL
ncbi:MAG: tetratricopeptide repeat protein [Alphaproteobacteria bacterium]|nr:tetratricopeptide repeat protein [Alphaproteobacteria bacterium]